MKKLIFVFIIALLLISSVQAGPPVSDCKYNCTFTGTSTINNLTVTGKTVFTDAQASVYRRIGDYLSLITPTNTTTANCSVMAFWNASITDGGTEINRCNAGTPAITYCAAATCTTGFESTSNTAVGMGHYLQFDATTDTVKIADNDNMFLSNGSNDLDFVIAGWFYFTNASSTQAFLINNSGTGGTGLEFRLRMLSSSQLQFDKQDNDLSLDCTITTTNALSANTWYHVVISNRHVGIGTQCADDFKIFINGVDNTTITSEPAGYGTMENVGGGIWFKNLAAGSRMSDFFVVRNGYITNAGALALYNLSRSYLCSNVLCF